MVNECKWPIPISSVILILKIWSYHRSPHFPGCSRILVLGLSSHGSAPLNPRCFPTRVVGTHSNLGIWQRSLDMETLKTEIEDMTWPRQKWGNYRARAGPKHPKTIFKPRIMSSNAWNLEMCLCLLRLLKMSLQGLFHAPSSHRAWCLIWTSPKLCIGKILW